MIEREILKDVKEYEPKLFGPFTLRQAACIGLAAITSVPTGLLLGQVFVNEIAIIGGAMLGVPFLLCGFKKVYNMPFEKFAIQFIRTQLLSPSTRKYQTKNYYETLLPIDNYRMNKKELKKYRKQQKKDLETMGPDFAIFK